MERVFSNCEAKVEVLYIKVCPPDLITIVQIQYDRSTDLHVNWCFVCFVMPHERGNYLEFNVKLPV